MCFDWKCISIRLGDWTRAATEVGRRQNHPTTNPTATKPRHLAEIAQQKRYFALVGFRRRRLFAATPGGQPFRRSYSNGCRNRAVTKSVRRNCSCGLAKKLNFKFRESTRHLQIWSFWTNNRKTGIKTVIRKSSVLYFAILNVNKLILSCFSTLIGLRHTAWLDTQLLGLKFQTKRTSFCRITIFFCFQVYYYFIGRTQARRVQQRGLGKHSRGAALGRKFWNFSF